MRKSGTQRSIILRDWEVRAIRDGRKTELLRPIEGERIDQRLIVGVEACEGVPDCWCVDQREPGECFDIVCPFGRVGDEIFTDGLVVSITSVRVMRLRDVTDEQARRLGIVDGGCLNCGQSEPCGCDDPAPCPSDEVFWYWNQDHGRDASVTNPWVWAIGIEKQ